MIRFLYWFYAECPAWYSVPVVLFLLILGVEEQHNRHGIPCWALGVEPV